MNKVNVLDHGYARLVSYMQPTNPDPAWTGDLEVVRNARVSYDAEWRTGEDAGKDAKLIDYLVKNHHTSPLEAMTFTFEIKAPIFVVRQWHRHRTWSYNEVSARYTELPEEFYVPEPDQITFQSASNKQMRTTTQHPLAAGYQQLIRNVCRDAFAQYQHMLANGVPRELARGVLPLNTYTHMFASVDLHNLAHFLRLRLHEHAQYEIRVYAEALMKLIEPVVPECVKALKGYRL
jgi:thymidylate synthase (FAD)